MTTIVFDSHTFIKRLRSTGFTEEQAETIVDASRDALSHLVTKEDLDSRLTELEQRLTIRLGAIVAVAVGVIATLIKIL
jgi:DNA-binding transcriptional MerR regulator